MIDLTFLRDLETLALTLNKESTSFGIGFLKVNLFVELSTLVFSYNSGPKVRITADSILETMMSTILSRDLPSRICTQSISQKNWLSFDNSLSSTSRRVNLGIDI